MTGAHWDRRKTINVSTKNVVTLINAPPKTAGNHESTKIVINQIIVRAKSSST